MHDVADFIAKYTEADRERVAFAWNSKHAAEFEDGNQEFRWTVVHACVAAPEKASPLLLEHLFLADAEWSREAWGSPHHFAELGGALLVRGEDAALGSFAKGFVASFDTFGSCHELRLPAELLARLTRHTQQALVGMNDEEQRKPLEATAELFTKLQAGSAAHGWARVEPGTSVTNVRVVWPRWYHKAWIKIASLWRSNAT
jgi:hypothetical protein